MAKCEQLPDGSEGLAGAAVPIFGEQMWNYYLRSYPVVRSRYFAAMTFRNLRHTPHACLLTPPMH